VSETPTRSNRSDLDEVRAGVLRRPGLVGVGLRRALTDAYDGWLGQLFGRLGKVDSIALVAVGGVGRHEPAPYSDLDLVLLYARPVQGLSELADKLWYPIWDSAIDLDHSVRTPDEALAVAMGDLKALLGLLDMRHVAGDISVSAAVRERIVQLWRSTALKRAPQLRELCQVRWAVAGEASFLLEPNLKDSRGGLRDTQSLRALALAQLVDVPAAARAATTTLLDVRGELQRLLGRNDDVLRRQEHAGVAAALSLADGDSALRAVNEAARTIALTVDNAWRRVAANGRTTRGSSSKRRLLAPFLPPGPDRFGLAKDVVAQGGEVVLARDADPGADPVLVLRAARAAAEHDLPLAPFALERLATEGAPLPEGWPAPALSEFVTLLGFGSRTVPVLESLDQVGLLVRLIPEWDAVRFAAQHNSVHRYTVDRHLLETAARAAELTRQVARPDLLLIGALLHDIGKGYPGPDHSAIGAPIAERIATRMGLSDADSATITALVSHHLLLPDTATRRDLDDPRTISTVANALSGSGQLLDLLHALTIADALATGAHVWSDWKAGLVADLVRRTRAVLAGAPVSAVPQLDQRRRRLAETGELAVEIQNTEVVLAAPATSGVLSQATGVLALHSLDVRSASIHTYLGMAVCAFTVEPRFGSLPDPAVVRTDLARAIDGSLALADRLAAKERSYARGAPARSQPPALLWFDDAATDATVLELRTDDSIGLLYRVISALERCKVQIRSALVSSLGGSVVDAFYLTLPDEPVIPAQARDRLESALAGI
jgi:[protein-PII] uridylyltransferase